MVLATSKINAGGYYKGYHDGVRENNVGAIDV